MLLPQKTIQVSLLHCVVGVRAFFRGVGPQRHSSGVHSKCSHWVDVKPISKVSVACVEKKQNDAHVSQKCLGHLDSKSVVRITFLSFNFKQQIRTVLEKSKNKSVQTAACILRTAVT